MKNFGTERAKLYIHQIRSINISLKFGIIFMTKEALNKEKKNAQGKKVIKVVGNIMTSLVWTIIIEKKSLQHV